MSRSPRPSPRTVIIGVAIAMWSVLAVDAPWHALGESRSTAVAVGLAIWGWTLWTLATIAMLVPSSVSLTAIRIIVPIGIVASIASASPVAVFSSIVVGVVASSAVLADIMVQGDAYGDERRFCLRTPVPQMAPAVVAWALLVGPVIIGSLGLCARQWTWGSPSLAIGTVAVAVIPRRLHRLARRWLVIVPAGVVLHDHVVLGETLMVMRSRITGVNVVAAPDDAADLTGGVVGPRVTITLSEAEKVVLSDITAKLLGTTIALHVTTFAFAPRRRDAALAALRR